MATYTPNLNLYKPDASDDFGSFREEFNNNMDKLDNGGGSGGHTILDGDGNALPQEGDLQFTGAVSVTDDNVNGKTIVDILGGNVYGAFIDPDRLIYSAFTFDGSTHSWTATEDVILTDNMQPIDSSSATFIRIDGKQVFASYVLDDPFVYVKKGQVVEYRGKSGSSMKAYAIQQGTNGIFAPVIYSDNERVIGVWRDNKPLYQRTFVLSSPITVNGSGTLLPNDIQTALADVEIMVDSECARDSTYSAFISPYVYKSGGQWYILSADNWGNVKFITLRYTKTTDVAGSGNWNTYGVPTVHYSTSEQVIGTYFGKPLYEKTWDNLSIAINGSNWVYFNDPVDIDNVVSFVACYQGANGFLHCAISEYQRSNSNGIMFAGFNGFNRTVNRITAQYTKTTD